MDLSRTLTDKHGYLEILLATPFALFTGRRVTGHGRIVPDGVIIRAAV
jgi:hypothetical protein